ncbi:MAG: hypothetical protein HQK53_20330, partial [Oligoflexia bacterium]|nr:hypothetical protein [Oligoflexia bacterium]
MEDLTRCGLSRWNTWNITRWLFPLLAGIFYILGFPSFLPFNFFLFPIIGLVLLFRCILVDINVDANSEITGTHRDLKAELISLIIFFVVINFVGYGWLSQTLQEFGEISPPINYLLATFYFLIVMPHYWVFWLLLILGERFLKKIKIKNKYKNKSNNVVIMNIILALLFVLCEYYIPVLFPPPYLGHAFMQITPYLGMAPVAGVPLFSFVSFWLVLSLVGFSRKQKQKQKDFLAPVVFLLFLCCNFLYPLPRLQEGISPKSTPQQGTRIRIVQANVGSVFK